MKSILHIWSSHIKIGSYNASITFTTIISYSDLLYNS
ncbi:hypothetical protein KEN51_CDS0148 [Pseudomonas phage vB_Pae10145-KEN51]|nr:hypothetical protein [Pseudomonas phage ANB1]WNV50270.1 hypothetical protein [Pseudomonas phage PhiPizzaParty]WRQ05590.1 hypothetical protein IPCDMZAV_CDS0067 [Pseudomonas phage 6B]WRQ06087.1 hypothetical protein QAMIJHJT_CDS0156 [Pseudomonas phage 9-Ps-8B]WRQ06495.1 hypothetical protein FOPPYZMZ_CDS0155 [Pseudomonas phage 9Ps-7B]WRQ06846.1 hypothetical protein ZBUARNPM_CDS0097 [Pseudomonas phage 14Ps5-6]